MSAYGRRVCAACFNDQPRASFSPAQWSKGGGASRCKGCVESKILASDERNPSARTSSNASRVKLTESRAFAHGGLRIVFRAQYLGGGRHGTAAVAKFFLERGGKLEEKAFAYDRQVVQKALRIVTQFNGGGAGARAIAALGGALQLNVPEVFSQLGTGLVPGHRPGAIQCLVEPYVHGFRKYNSNSGFVGGSDAVSDALQALSHYSYHASGGMLVLCDLQCGTATKHGGVGLVLSDPVIMSRFAGRYGPTDLGAAGIGNFFSQHGCTAYCNPRWTKPTAARATLPIRESTSMTVATYSPPPRRTPLPGIAEDDGSEYD